MIFNPILKLDLNLKKSRKTKESNTCNNNKILDNRYCIFNSNDNNNDDRENDLEYDNIGKPFINDSNTGIIKSKNNY